MSPSGSPKAPSPGSCAVRTGEREHLIDAGQQPCPVGSFDAHPGTDREAAAVGVGCHVFGITGLKVAACHEGAQDALAHIGLHLGHGGLIETHRCVKIDRQCIGQRLKHPVDHADVENFTPQTLLLSLSMRLTLA